MIITCWYIPGELAITAVGRMINHSKKHPNIVPQIVSINEIPHIGFFARTDISSGAELLYDYGDRSSSAIQAHPWLSNYNHYV